MIKSCCALIKFWKLSVPAKITTTSSTAWLADTHTVICPWTLLNSVHISHIISSHLISSKLYCSCMELLKLTVIKKKNIHISHTKNNKQFLTILLGRGTLYTAKVA